MTFDEMSVAILNSPLLEKHASDLDFLLRWKTSTDDIFHLVEKMAAYLRHAEDTFDPATLEELVSSWGQFKAASIDSIHGMTMNERLWQFGLFAKFDNSKNLAEQNRIYSKLAARR